MAVSDDLSVPVAIGEKRADLHCAIARDAYLRKLRANLPAMSVAQPLGRYVQIVHDPRIEFYPTHGYAAPRRRLLEGTWLEQAWFVNLAAATLAASFFFAVFIKSDNAHPPESTPVTASRISGA